MTFQAALFEASNNILFSYLDVTTHPEWTNGVGATIGIRDQGGQTDGRNLQWEFSSNPASRLVVDNESILFTPVPSPGLYCCSALAGPSRERGSACVRIRTAHISRAARRRSFVRTATAFSHVGTSPSSAPLC